MERVFEYDKGFINVSLVEQTHYAGVEDSKHIVQVLLSDKIHLNLKFGEEIDAEEFVTGLVKAVRQFHGLEPPESQKDADAERINIKGKELSEILYLVSKCRLNKCNSIREAAESLGIDIRTFKRYVEWTNT